MFSDFFVFFFFDTIHQCRYFAKKCFTVFFFFLTFVQIYFFNYFNFSFQMFTLLNLHQNLSFFRLKKKSIFYHNRMMFQFESRTYPIRIFIEIGPLQFCIKIVSILSFFHFFLPKLNFFPSKIYSFQIFIKIYRFQFCI